MKKHNKITASERDQIAWWLASGVTIREMARRLGRSPSSISQELKRNQVDGSMAPLKPTKLPKHGSATPTRNISCATAPPSGALSLRN